MATHEAIRSGNRVIAPIVQRRADARTAAKRKAAREKAKESSSKSSSPMVEKMSVKSIYSKTKRLEFEQQSQKKKEAKEKATADKKERTRPDVKIKGRNTGFMNVFQPNGFYHSASLDFALGRPNFYGNIPLPKYSDEELETWGTGFGNPLVNPKRNCIYVVRARIDQLRADPMIGGFKLRWEWPNGWTPIDNVPRVQFVEASSNPLYIMRVFLSPATKIESGGVFRCRIRSWYP